MLTVIEKILYILSNFFYIPVVIGLFILLVYVFYILGQFIAEALQRLKRKNAYIFSYLNKMQALPYLSIEETELELEKIIHEAQKKNIRKIHAAKYCVKIGPTAGLIGTLTPMARALASLSTGDLNTLSSQMISAFSTTVLGLIVGGIAYSIAHVRIKWQKEDRYKLGLEAEEVYKNINS